MGSRVFFVSIGSKVNQFYIENLMKIICAILHPRCHEALTLHSLAVVSSIASQINFIEGSSVSDCNAVCNVTNFLSVKLLAPSFIVA
jgi:hypothetical protein